MEFVYTQLLYVEYMGWRREIVGNKLTNIYIYSLYSNCLCLLGQLGENKNLFNFKSLALFWNQIKMHVALDLCKLGGRNRLEFFGWQKHKIGFSKCIINYYYCLDACMKFPEVVHIYDNYDQLKVVCVIIIHE